MTKSHNTERSPLHFGARGKRRSEGQRIGKKGQRIFEEWAEDQSVVANSCPDDYGVDYFCQVLSRPSGEYHTEEARGEVFAAQVRSVKGTSRPRIAIDKTDAEAALRIESPYVLIGVDTTSRKVYYRFLDTQLAEHLAIFVAGETAALTFALDSSHFQLSNFRDAVAHHCRPGIQHQLRIFCAELCIQRDIPGARLRVTHDASQGHALIEVPWITSIFCVPPEDSHTFRQFIFERGTLPTEQVGGIGVHPSLFKALDIAGTDRLVVHGVFEEEIDAVIALGERAVRLPLRVRVADGETGFVSDCGLVLTLSDAIRSEDGRFCHRLRFTLSREHARCLDSFSEFDAPIRLLRAGATISFDSDGANALPASSWGPAFEHLGDGYEQIVDGCAFAGVALKGIRLADLLDEEFARSVWFLSAFADGRTLMQSMPAVLVGPAANDPNFMDHCRRVGFEVPIAMNVNDHGVVIWVSGEALACTYEQGVCGFIPVSQERFRVEVKSTRFSKRSSTPEVWLCKWWPAVKILEQPTEFYEEVGDQSYEHELGGRLFELSNSKSSIRGGPRS